MSVLLLADAEAGARYTPQLESKGLKVHRTTVLAYDYSQDGITRLRKHLNDGGFSGVVVTSARAASAVNLIYEDLDAPKIPDFVYGVGSSTARSLPERLREKCRGLETGNAKSLAEFIAKENPGRLLFPCGDLASDTLVKKLDLETIVVYETKCCENLENELVKLKNNEGLPENIVFFSPSGVDFVIPVLKRLNYDFGRSKLFAIGPSTETRISEKGFEPFATAKEPSPQGIASLFENGSINST